MAAVFLCMRMLTNKMSCVALCISVSEAARVLRDVKIVRVSGDWSLRDMLQEVGFGD